jgi:3',5'-cyclic AMP phosphodiesterase CpdA
VKIIHLTDPHIVPSGRRLHGLEPLDRLRECIDSINVRHSDALLCVITGDLTDGGTVEEYEAFQAALDDLKIPYRLLLGNHDDRAAFRAVFADAHCDDSGFVQSALDVPSWGRLLFLDTVDSGQPNGRICASRLAWVKSRLAEVENEPVYVFMHHPLLPVGVRHFEGMCLADPEPLLACLRAHRGGIRHIFFGHVHLPVSGSWFGMPFTASRGTCHHIILDIDNPAAAFAATTPSYDVALLQPSGVSVHTYDFLDQKPILGGWPPEMFTSGAPISSY